MIKRRRDIPRFIKNFFSLADYDGQKYYIVLGDTTIMRYPSGEFTYYRKNEVFWDLFEHEIEPEKLHEFLWERRKKINSLF